MNRWDFWLSSTGRLPRVPFLIGGLVLLGLAGAFESIARTPVHRVAAWVVDPVLLFCTACILCRRLHDMGRAGWWAFVPVIAVVMAWPWPRDPVTAVAGVVFAAVALWLVLAPGQAGMNCFGEA